MKITIKALLVLMIAPSIGAVATKEELITNRKASIADWKQVLSVLRQAGYTEKNRSYRRVMAALRRSETRLKNLQSGSIASYVRHGKARDILGTLGMYGRKPRVQRKVSAPSKTKGRKKSKGPRGKKTTHTRVSKKHMKKVPAKKGA